jgi:hypothetical protein
LAKMRKGMQTIRAEFRIRPENLHRHPPKYNFVRPGPWSALVCVLIIVLISYCHMKEKFWGGRQDAPSEMFVLPGTNTNKYEYMGAGLLLCCPGCIPIPDHRIQGNGA